VSIDDRGELGALAAEFNVMAAAIQRRDAQLSAQQEQLLHRERLATVGKLSAQITHELRNPLSSIGLNSELLKEELAMGQGVADLDGARELLSNIIREVERLREITEEYLRFARLPRPECVPVDLNHAAGDLMEFVRTEMQRAKVRIRLDADRAAHPAYVDPNQLRAALLNLLRNAREAMPDGGHVVLRVRSLGGQATVEVIDDGPGVPDDLRERLFEPFFSTKPQGTGLGLSMVRKIMDALDGEVSISSVPGKGTTVRLSMPLAPTEALHA
jgi:signal transduction histidine kinase